MRLKYRNYLCTYIYIQDVPFEVSNKTYPVSGEKERRGSYGGRKSPLGARTSLISR